MPQSLTTVKCTNSAHSCTFRCELFVRRRCNWATPRQRSYYCSLVATIELFHLEDSRPVLDQSLAAFSCWLRPLHVVFSADPNIDTLSANGARTLLSGRGGARRGAAGRGWGQGVGWGVGCCGSAAGQAGPCNYLPAHT